MTTTVRITKRDRERLRRLGEHWRRRRGQATHQEVLASALAFAEGHLDEFLTNGAWRPLASDEWRRLQAEVVDRQGWQGSVDDIDDVVYRP